MYSWRRGNQIIPVSWLAKFYRVEVLGLSQMEMQERIGVKQPHIVTYERGKDMAFVHNAYVEAGLADWWASLTKGNVDFLYKLYTKKWCKDDV